MWPEQYVALNFGGAETYVRKDRLEKLEKIDGVVFDCDGVLIDIRGSYNRAISKAVAYILEGITGTAVPEDIVPDEVIFLFRKSGGFNCDRDTVYGILMFVLSRLPEEVRKKLRGLLEEVGWQPDPFKRFSLMRDAARRNFAPNCLGSEFFAGSINEVKGFTELLDATGAASADKNLAGAPGVSEDSVGFFNALKRFLRYPEDVDESIVSAVFEEFFCGPRLYQDTYGVEAKFHKGRGLIENEKVIIQPEALDHLASIIGEANLGVASGSKLEPARYVLGGILEKFNPKALIFLDNVEKAELERSGKECSKVSLKKPHPFSLLKSAKAFRSSSLVLYVGDSMEDAMMVREAGKLGKCFLFAGVYRYSGVEETVLRSFLESGCDVALPSVNELPLVLEASRSEKK